MQTFSYKAIGADGKEKKGSIDAENRQQATKKLKEDGLLPISVEEQSLLDKDISFSFGGKRKKKVTARDMSVFCRQFSSILRAGVSVVKALEMLGAQTENKNLKAAVIEVQSSVEKGSTLSDAMRMKKDVFPDLLISMVSAGEASGSLETAIDRMAIQFEKDAKIKSMVKKAMMYPMVLLVVAVGVMLLMITYVIPQFEDMFNSIDSELPVYTRAVLWLGDFITGKWWLLILIIVAIVFAYRTYKKTDTGRHQIDKIKLKIPVFGMLATKTACARFSRTLSTLLKSGMSMMDALDIVADTMENVIYKDALVKARSGVALGFELSQQLEATGLFPPMVVHMASIGEETGNMEEMLTNVANYYDEEVEVATQQVTALMEPIIIVVMAVMVAVLVLCIYGPMAQLYDDLG